MAKTEEYLQDFVTGLESSLGENLVSAVLYGSAARGDHYSPESDLNVLVVLKEFELDKISEVRKVIQHGYKKARIEPVFWTADELKNASDVFPVEFNEIVNHHQALYGADPVTSLALDNKNLRHQIEFELRGKLLRLRKEWLHFSDSPKSSAGFLIKTGNSFMILFQQAQKMTGGKLDASLSDAFRRCVLLKKGEIKLDKDELLELYKDAHDSAVKIVQSIDKI